MIFVLLWLNTQDIQLFERNRTWNILSVDGRTVLKVNTREIVGEGMSRTGVAEDSAQC